MGDCAICGVSHANFDRSRSPAGFPQPGRENDCTPLGEPPNPEDLVCARCYVGYPPRDSDGKLWWVVNK